MLGKHPKMYRDGLNGLPRRKVLGRGGIDWRRCYELLMKSRAPVSVSDFSETHSDVLDFDHSEAFLGMWNKHICLTPQHLAKVMIEDVGASIRLKAGFAKDGKFDLFINGYERSGREERRIFFGQIEIDMLSANAEEKKYYVEDGALRGRGYIKPILQNLHKIYENLGVRVLRVSAELDNGAYVWARAGYLPTQAAWSSLSKKLSFKLLAAQDFLLGQENIKQKYYDLILRAAQSDDPRNVWLISDIALPVQGQKMGYFLLAGERWKGYLRLDDPSQRERYNQFVGGGRHDRILCDDLGASCLKNRASIVGKSLSL